jgi:hypothetical protein
VINFKQFVKMFQMVAVVYSYKARLPVSASGLGYPATSREC